MNYPGCTLKKISCIVSCIMILIAALPLSRLNADSARELWSAKASTLPTTTQ